MNATIPEEQTRGYGEETAKASALGDDELRKQAIARLKRKRRFVENLAGYVTINGALWLIWALTGHSMDGSMPWPAWVSAVWGFFLAIDAWKAFGWWPRSLYGPITETDIAREMERSRRA